LDDHVTRREDSEAVRTVKEMNIEEGVEEVVERDRVRYHICWCVCVRGKSDQVEV